MLLGRSGTAIGSLWSIRAWGVRMFEHGAERGDRVLAEFFEAGRVGR